MRKLKQILGAVAVIGVVLVGTALVYWNLWGQRPYGEACNHALGCRSFACLHHGLAGPAQVSAPGRCTKSCATDAECGAGAQCVALGDDARGDLPPFGKPDRACMIVLTPARP